MSSSEGGAPRVTDNLSAPSNNSSTSVTPWVTDNLSAPSNPSSTQATDNMSAPQKSSTLVDTPATESLSDTADLIARTGVATTRRELPLEKLPLLQRRNRRDNPNVKRAAEKHEDDRGGKRHELDDKDTADLTAQTQVTTIRRALPLEELPLLQRRNRQANPNVKRVTEKHEDDQGGKRQLDNIERDFFTSNRAMVPMLTAQQGRHHLVGDQVHYLNYHRDSRLGQQCCLYYRHRESRLGR